jgi:hypothetical protein
MWARKNTDSENPFIFNLSEFYFLLHIYVIVSILIFCAT